ncbi:MAG: RidA family protein, partial [Alphaproteobacteria bacterium]
PDRQRSTAMQRTSVNPKASDWGLRYGMDQGEVVTGATRHLRCSGQCALVSDADQPFGYRTLHVSDIAGQMRAALANIDAILDGAGMGRQNIVFLRFFTVDVDAFLANYQIYADWIAPAGTRPPQSLLGLARLATPDLLVEIECEACSNHL